MTGPHWQVPLDEDYHVHSTFSDGASTLAENVRAARERGLRTLCLVDHVRRDTSWLPDFAAAVARYRQQSGLHVLAGVEAKILNTSGQLDLPPGLDGIDLVLVADHQFPTDTGPAHPAHVRDVIRNGSMTADEAIERLCEATANAVGATDRVPLLAHLFSVLPKIGLDEDMVPGPLLDRLARRAAHAGALVEVNEKWSCPSARTIAAMARSGVQVVAGSDSHHCRDIGVYRTVRDLSRGTACGSAPRGSRWPVRPMP
jgi:putative hydrolase